MVTAVLLAASLSAAPAAQQACTGPYQIVEAAYRQVLERQPDASSTTFVTALDTGQMTVRELVATLARSPEHVKRFFWAPLISAVYRQVLQRAPSPQELELATAQLVDQQMTVPEFVANTATRAANGEEDAVRILYRRLLGREPDPEGLRNYTEIARRDGIGAVARAIVASPEYAGHAGADGVPGDDFAAYQEAVTSLYQHILGRQPDPAGLRDLTRVAIAQGVDAVVDQMINSSEYAQLYGNDVIPGHSGSRLCRGVATSGTVR